MRNNLLKFAHRQIWQRLPRDARRTLLIKGSAWLAPRVPQDVKAAAPIIVVGPLRAASGLGEGARVCHDALKKAGLPVYGIDVSQALLYNEDYQDYNYEDGRHLIGSGTLFLHVGGPLVPLILLRLGRTFLKDKYVVAHWVWELSRVPDDWRAGVPFVHEIWAPSHFAAEAIGTIADARPIHVLHHPIDSPEQRSKLGPADAGRPFTALVIFNVASSFERKNPCAAIRAFRQAFGDDPGTHLIVKYSNAFAYPKTLHLLEAAGGHASNVTLVGETLDAVGVDALYARADVVMSLHRAEGFGLVVAEAMLRGIPVIATDWSGNTDFLTDKVGMPISYTLVPARDPQDTYELPNLVWAEADVASAAKALKALREDQELRNRLGHAAKQHATELFSPQAYANRVKELLGLS